MAIGVSLMLNIKLPANFNSPYKARDIQDFWRRWHITLSRFLRDYIYIPLGGNQVSKYRNSFNLFSVFLIGGLWHGASWMFVLWGALHGMAIVIHRIWKDLGFKMNSFLAWFITFNFINITWVFFRAKHWDDALKVLGGMIGFHGIALYKPFENWLHYLSYYSITFGHVFIDLHEDEDPFWWIVVIIILIIPRKNSMQMLETFQPHKKLIVFIVAIFTFSVLGFNHVSEFLYFNF
jgi:D-alanyl-lipoteichoic acid acyltransferase DltB (MBOAT superfamily)